MIPVDVRVLHFLGMIRLQQGHIVLYQLFRILLLNLRYQIKLILKTKLKSD